MTRQHLRHPPVGVATSVAIGLLVALAAGPTAARAADAGKLVIVALDGFTPSVGDPLLAAGRLPTLDRLADQGVALTFDSFNWFKELSTARTWITMSTGQPPERTIPGREGAVYESGGGSDAPFIQEIVGRSGRSVAVVGWPFAEPPAWNGTTVTHDFTKDPADGYVGYDGTTYPAELEAELVPLRVAGAGITQEEIAHLIDGDPAESPENASIVTGIDILREYYAADATIVAAARHIVETGGQPDFLMVFLMGLGECSRDYWGYMDPSTLPKPLDAEATAMFRDTIPRYYEHADRQIGEILNLIEDGSTVVVCSGYGYRGPVVSKDGLKLGMETRVSAGTLFAAGPRIRRGGEVIDVRIFDIAPTLLALAGAPVPMSMGGFVLTGILDEDFMRRNPIDYVDDLTTD